MEEQRLSSAALAMLGVLRRASSANRLLPQVQMSRARMAEAVGVSEMTVERSAAVLHRLGLVEYRPARWTPDSGYDRAEQVPDVYMLDWEKVMEWQEGENMRRELRAQWEELPQQDRRRVSYTDWCAGAR